MSSIFSATFSALKHQHTGKITMPASFSLVGWRRALSFMKCRCRRCFSIAKSKVYTVRPTKQLTTYAHKKTSFDISGATRRRRLEFVLFLLKSTYNIRKKIKQKREKNTTSVKSSIFQICLILHKRGKFEKRFLDEFFSNEILFFLSFASLYTALR